MEINNKDKLIQCERLICSNNEKGYCQCDIIFVKKESFLRFKCTSLKDNNINLNTNES